MELMCSLHGRHFLLMLFQVVFADHTEILLSNEARVVTFVDKHGNRETHSLQGVLQDQRWGCV